MSAGRFRKTSARAAITAVDCCAIIGNGADEFFGGVVHLGYFRAGHGSSGIAVRPNNHTYVLRAGELMTMLLLITLIRRLPQVFAVPKKGTLLSVHFC